MSMNEYKISNLQAQEAVDTLERYVKQLRGEMSDIERLVSLTRETLHLPNDFSIADLVLSTKARNVLINYYRQSKGNVGILNTSERELLRVRNCGKLLVSEIRKEFERHGISLID